MSMRTWWRRPLDRSFLMIGGMVAFAGVGQLLMPAQEPTPTTVVVPISSLALVCPALPADVAGFNVSVKGALVSGRGQAEVEVQSTRLSHGLVKDGIVKVTAINRPASALYSATGDAAPRLVADASITGSSTATRGFATYSCQPPSTSQWLVGGASVSGRTSVLTVANVEDTAATIDVEVWTELGKSGARSLSGIEIPPHSRTQLNLGLVEPGRRMYAVHVIATSGQVTSAIFDRGQQALASLGADVVPAVAAPLASSIVGILPAGAVSATLGVLSPGTPTAVKVSLITSDGTYELAGAEHLALDADKLALIPIPDDAITGDVAVLVQADSPVVAGVGDRLKQKGNADLASATMLAPIYRAASFTVDASVSEATALLYSDVDSLVTFTVRTGKDVSTKAVTIKAGQVQRVKVLGGQGSSHVVSISPAVDGMVRGAVQFLRGSMGAVTSSIEPLASLRGFVTVPPVAPAVSR